MSNEQNHLRPNRVGDPSMSALFVVLGVVMAFGGGMLFVSGIRHDSFLEGIVLGIALFVVGACVAIYEAVSVHRVNSKWEKWYDDNRALLKSTGNEHNRC